MVDVMMMPASWLTIEYMKIEGQKAVVRQDAINDIEPFTPEPTGLMPLIESKAVIQCGLQVILYNVISQHY